MGSYADTLYKMGYSRAEAEAIEKSGQRPVTVSTSSPTSSASSSSKSTNSSSSNTSTKSSSNPYSGMTAAQLANERQYLNNLIAGGGGDAEWAKNQLNLLNSVQPVTTTTPTVTTTTQNQYTNYQPQYQYTNYADQIEQMYEQQRAAQLEALKRAKEQELSALNTQKIDVENQYTSALGKLDLARQQAPAQFQAQRNMVSGDSALAVQRLREALANSGQLHGGFGESTLARNTAAMQAALGNITQQEVQYMGELNLKEQDLNAEKAANLAKIAEAIRLANEAASSEELQLANEIGAQQSKALLDALYKADDRAFAIDDRNYQRYRDSVEDLYKERTLSMQEEAAKLNNEAQRLINEINQLKLSNLPAQIKLDLEEQEKRIAQIGKAPYRSAEQVQLDKLKVEEAKLKIDQLKNGLNDPYLSAYRTRANRVYSEGGIEGLIEYLKSLEAAGVPESTIRQIMREYGISD